MCYFKRTLYSEKDMDSFNAESFLDTHNSEKFDNIG